MGAIGVNCLRATSRRSFSIRSTSASIVVTPARIPANLAGELSASFHYFNTKSFASRGGNSIGSSREFQAFDQDGAKMFTFSAFFYVRPTSTTSEFLWKLKLSHCVTYEHVYIPSCSCCWTKYLLFCAPGTGNVFVILKFWTFEQHQRNFLPFSRSLRLSKLAHISQAKSECISDS